LASFHASTGAVSRGSGHSATAKSAYISGQEITDGLTGEIHNYTRRDGVEHTEVMLPSGIDKEITAQELWNKAELAENRKDARVAREWTIALPHELTAEQRKELAQDLAREITDRYQVGTQLAIHKPSRHGDDRNYHVHIMSSTRKIDQNLNLTEKADIERDRKQCTQMGIPNSQEQIIQLREMISTKINQHLEKANVQEQVTHLSYKDQGLDRIPTRHMGKEITQLERQGVKTELGDYNRHARSYNELKTNLEAIFKQQKEQEAHKPNKTTEIFRTKEQELLAKIQAKYDVNKIVSKYNAKEAEHQKRIEQEKRLEKQKDQEKNYQKIKDQSKNRGFER
jgi:hypothetical protein